MPVTIVDANFNPAPTVQRAAMTSNVGVLGGTEVQRKAISSVFGVPDVGARVLEKTITLGPGIMVVQVRLSQTAGLLAWLSDTGVQIGALLDLEPLRNHSLELRFTPSSRDRFLQLNLEVVNP